MKSSNRLLLNRTTMIEAVQVYLDTLFRDGKSPKVQCVDFDGSTINGIDFFKITVEERDTLTVEDLQRLTKR